MMLTLSLSVYFAFIIHQYPLIGIGLNKIDDEWVVKSIHDTGWASTQPIEKGSIVQRIDGKKPDQHLTVTLFNRIEKANSITLSDHETYFVTRHDQKEQYFIYLWIPLLFTFVTLLLGILLFRKQVNNQSATVLFYFLLSLGLGYFSASISVRGDIIGKIINTISFLGTVVLFLHFINSYFRKFTVTIVSDRSLKVLYGLIGVVLLTEIYSFFLPSLNNAVTMMKLIVFLMLLSFAVYRLGKFYMTHKTTEKNPILNILLLTLVIAFGPFVVLYVIPYVFGGKAILRAELAAAFLIVIPIAFVYLQLAERLFDISFFLNRIRYYTMLVIPYSVLFALLISFFSDEKLLSQFTFLTSGTLFVCTLLLLYGKEHVDYKLRAHLFSQKGDFDTSLYSFFQKTKRITKVQDLMQHFQNEIKDVLKVKEVFLVQILLEDEETRWALKGKQQLSEGSIQKLEKVEWSHYPIGSLVKIADGYGIVIGGNDMSKNLIIIDLKHAKTNLNIQEKIWLETLAYFSSILLENVQTIEDMIGKIEAYQKKHTGEEKGHPLWLSKIMFALSEKERTNLSMDLHDSVLQDQLQLLREVESMAEQVTDPTVQNHFAYLKERLLDNIHLVRETCNELRPPFLSELGIIQSLQNLFAQTKLRSSFLLKTKVDSEIHGLSDEVELAVYRIVQELLTNAMKHSFATKVDVSLQWEDDVLLLNYNDNGIGIDMEKLNNSFQTMGIFGMQERVRSVGGTVVHVQTAPQKGLSVQFAFRRDGI